MCYGKYLFDLWCCGVCVLWEVAFLLAKLWCVRGGIYVISGSAWCVLVEVSMRLMGLCGLCVLLGKVLCD